MRKILYIFEQFYRGCNGEVLRDFLSPAVQQAVLYDRAVGYFTACSMSLIADSLSKSGGLPADLVTRIVASPKLDEQDILEIGLGYELKEVIERNLIRTLDVEDVAVNAGLGVIGSMILSGQLEIKIAFTSIEGMPGDYHEKIGLLTNKSGKRVAFIGSLNETCRAFDGNYESVAVFSEDTGEDRDMSLVDSIATQFEDLWGDRAEGLTVLDFPDVAKDKLISIARRMRSQSPVNIGMIGDVTPEIAGFAPPEGMQLFKHQEDAIKGWVKNSKKGLFKMATGSGKTKTSLYATYSELISSRSDAESTMVLIVAPSIPLIEQWVDELYDWGTDALDISGGFQNWLSDIRLEINALNNGSRELLFVVASNASFGLKSFQDELSRFEGRGILIADEAHNLGSDDLINSLPGDSFGIRIGLSATPERYNDDPGTARLLDYFGGICFEYSLADAIRDGNLCPYEYFPRIVRLSPSETEEYVEINVELSRLGNSNISDASTLVAKRDHLLNFAINKLDAFRNDVIKFKDRNKIIVFCAQGSTEIQGVGRKKHIELVTSTLGNALNMTVDTITGEDSRPRRRQIIDDFAAGDIQVLAAMKVLNEGVDIPSARVAFFLESTRNPREFVQRRGRVLRKAAGKDKAEIFDYLVLPSLGSNIPLSLIEVHLKKEIQRAREFAQIAINSDIALEIISGIESEFNIVY